MEKELLVSAAEVLGISSFDLVEKDPGMELVLKSFEEGEKTDKSKNARNILVYYSIEKQLKAGDGKFVFFKAPFDDFCPTCEGTGNEFEIEVNHLPVTCKKCNGSGYKRVKCKACENGNLKQKDGKCPVCKGSEKYEIRPIHKEVDCESCDENGKDESGNTCQVCNGTKKYRAEVRKGKACPSCRTSKDAEKGLGHVNIIVSAKKIKKMWECRSCGGTGKKNKKIKRVKVTDSKDNIETPQKRLTSPLLSEDVVKQLAEKE